MTETNINALCSVEAVFDGVDIDVTVEFSAGGGTFEHDELTAESRAKANQHPISSITGLQSALDGKANSAHAHTISDVTGLQLALDGKSNFGHGHSISDITNLTQQLSNAKNSSAGVTVEPTCTNNDDGTVTIGNFKANLYSTSDFSGDLVEYDITGGTFELNDSVVNPSAVNYFVADYNSGTPILKLITDVNLITESSVIPVYTCFRTGNFIHPLDWDSIGRGMVNKIHQRLVKTQRFQRETGVMLSETATRVINISTGAIWYGANRIALETAISNVDTCFLYYHSAGQWTRQLITRYNNTQYDNGTNIVELTTNRYAVNWIWRGVENAKHIYVVLGGGDYTLSQAQASTIPPVPPIISGHCYLVGRIIVQKNASVATQIDNTQDVTFATRTVIEHNDLTGRDALDVHPKESITGITILDAPEFADTQITPLANEATYSASVWSYLVGLFTTVPKSVLQHLVKIWNVIENLKSRVITLETKVIADFTLPTNQSVASFLEINIANLGIAQGQDFSVHVYLPALPDNAAQANISFRFNAVDTDTTKYYLATSDSSAISAITGATEGSFIMTFRWKDNKVEGMLTTYRITSGTRTVQVTAVGTNGTWLTAVSSFIIRTTQIVTWPAGIRVIIKKM